MLSCQEKEGYFGVELRVFYSWNAPRLRAPDEVLWLAGTIDLVLFPRSRVREDAKSAEVFDWKGGEITSKMKTEVQRKRYDNKLGAACMQLMLYAFMLEQNVQYTSHPL